MKEREKDTSIVQDKSDAEPSAQVIFQRMASIYKSCKSYRDTGTVTAIIRRGAILGERREVVCFETAFARPNRFRFMYDKEEGLGRKQRYVIWAEQQRVYTWWTLRPRIQVEKSISLAIAGAVGISTMPAHTIPRLLIPRKVRGWAVTELKDPKVVGNEDAENIDCFIVKGEDVFGGSTQLWIDAMRYLVVKIVERRTEPDVETTTIYRPELNVSIPDTAFEANV